MLRRIGGPDSAGSLLALDDIAPALVQFAIGFAYGEVLSRPALDLKTRQVCTVGALTAMGHAAPQLKWHIDAALNVGVAPSQIFEIQGIANAYAGRPEAAMAIAAPPLDAPALDHLTRELATVALLTALGTRPAALKQHLDAALQRGASHEQIIEVLQQMAVYAGFPAALNGVAAAREVFDAARK